MRRAALSGHAHPLAGAIALALALLAASAASASAQPDPGTPDIPRREVPDYDGRPDPGISAEDALLWIPRVLAWPLHAVLEYVLRRPIGWILTTAERERWDAVQFPPFAESRPSWGLVPTLFVDFGFQPSGGIYLWFEDVFIRGNALKLQLGFGGLDWLRATLVDRARLTRYAELEATFDAWMRPDHLYLGLGPDARPDREARYGRRRMEGRLAVNFRPWRASHLRIEAGVIANEFYDTTYLSPGQLTVSDAVAQGWFAAPPGFAQGYTSYWQRVEGSIDTREGRPANGSGIRVQGHVALGFDIFRPLERRWLLWGAGAGAFWDISEGRTLALWAVAELATRLGPDPIPFTELPDIGGRGRMTAFRRAWLTGESVVAASIEYRWPLWIALDGFLNVSVGNAFGPDLAGFSFGKLRMSYALGLRTVGDPDQSLTFQIGFGTATFDEGLDPVIFRLTAGMQEGF